jgi:hypothetical protein
MARRSECWCHGCVAPLVGLIRAVSVGQASCLSFLGPEATDTMPVPPLLPQMNDCSYRTGTQSNGETIESSAISATSAVNDS